MRQVIAVRTDTINIPEPHEHVIAVRLEDGSDLSVGEVMEVFKSGEHLWMRSEEGIETVLHIHPCPTCDAWPFLCEGNAPESDGEYPTGEHG